MPSISCKVVNKKGLHARASAKVVTLLSNYPKSKVTLSHGKITAPGDSLIKLLTLNAPVGSIIKISVESEYNEESRLILSKINDLFDNGFGE